MSCEECHYKDEVTGACVLDDVECVDDDQFVKALAPEDMYKALYLLIYNMPFAIQKHVMAGTIPSQSFAGIPVEAMEDFDAEKMKILFEYDRKLKRWILETSEQPKAMQKVLVKVPKKIIRRRQKLFIPGRN